MKRTVLLLAAFLCAAPAQAQQQCGLKLYAALSPIADSGGDPTIPVTIGSKTYRMVFQPDNAMSAIAQRVLDEQDLKSEPIGGAYTFWGDKNVTRKVTLPMLEIGALRGRVTMLVLHDPPEEGADGVLGGDILTSVDVEADPKNGRINLFSPNHCPGKVVYWASSYARLPMQIDKSGHPYYEMELDGKTLTVSFSWVQQHDLMSLAVLQQEFGLDVGSPGMTVAEGVNWDGKPMYRYPFKSLSLSGLTIANPGILIHSVTERPLLDQTCNPYIINTFTQCYGKSQLTLGKETLQHLHFYFAYKERALYITPADAHL